MRVRQYDGNKIQFRYNAYEEVVYAEDTHHKVHFEYTPMGSLAARKENGIALRFNYNTEEKLVSLINEKKKYTGCGMIMGDEWFGKRDSMGLSGIMPVMVQAR
ncbi:hypothetical protein [Paraflavitalea speifideaquila]|uniref:hypothetical protein n=1 Tax=Paraflavitalea speifideaquila TaxID=3076558 RepID=UPI0028E3C003|nr:hypothetical protein [Paraflavitalea speifideiaquila]